MDLDFSEEQEMLRKTARDFLANEFPMTLVREMADDERGYTPELWHKLADLGWLGLAFPEEYGGSGANFLDLVALLEEMGRGCFSGPFFSTAVLGGLTILDAGTEEQKREFLPKIAGGESILTLALTERDVSYEPSGVRLKATADKDGYILDGEKLFVPDAHIADWLLCVARTTEDTMGVDGITVFLTDANSPGISYTVLKTLAGDKQCRVVFDSVKVPKTRILGELDQGWPIVYRALQRATVAQCAEMLGGAQRVLEMVVDYAKDRQQFGRAIGSFQAIQHHAANMAIDVDGMRLTTYEAAWMLSEGLPCAKEVAMAKAWASDAYKRIALLGVKIHGGVGYMQDHDATIYFRRAEAAEAAFGNSTLHREMVTRGLGL